jgi:hypothetical protein
MSVLYNGEIPTKNYSLDDFRNHRIIMIWCNRFMSDKIPSIRACFRSNGLSGEIRTTCYGDTYAVDVRWGWWSDRQRCLTTECKTIREAKSILFLWFASKGYSRSNEQISQEQYSSFLRFDNVQLSLF